MTIEGFKYSKRYMRFRISKKNRKCRVLEITETTPSERLWLRCRSCRKVWFPDARKWKDKNPTDERIIQCPFCHVQNVIPRSVVMHLLKRVHKTEWGYESISSTEKHGKRLRKRGHKK